MSVFVKICGLANAADVEAVAALQPDAMGFIFYPKSPRAVSPEDVGTWTRDLPDSIRIVGVTVDRSPEDNQRIRDLAGLDVLQLHGSEIAPADDAENWKVLHLDRQIDADLTRFSTLLIDSYTEALPGGTGIQLDWDRARAFVETQAQHQVILAGGLTAAGVAEAITAVRPFGVDVASGVEAAPGKKDIQAVQDFIQAARSAVPPN